MIKMKFVINIESYSCVLITTVRFSYGKFQQQFYECAQKDSWMAYVITHNVRDWKTH